MAAPAVSSFLPHHPVPCLGEARRGDQEKEETIPPQVSRGSLTPVMIPHICITRSPPPSPTPQRQAGNQEPDFGAGCVLFRAPGYPWATSTSDIGPLWVSDCSRPCASTLVIKGEPDTIPSICWVNAEQNPSITFGKPKRGSDYVQREEPRKASWKKWPLKQALKGKSDVSN